MPNPPMFYREESPSAETSHFVLSYWEFTIDAENPQPIMHEVFPEGCVTIIFYRNRLLSNERLFVSAINPKSIYIPMQKGDTMYGMRILPEACAAFFSANPAEIVTATVEKENLGARFSAELPGQLDGCGNFAEVINVYENYAKKISAFGVRKLTRD